jgi:uncharacterized protein (DUF2252 family)
MELFNYRLLALPGKSRIFRIADFMRTNIAPNMVDDAKLMNIIKIVNRYKRINETILSKIKIDISNTYNRAFNIKANKGWIPVKTLSISSIVAHWFIVLCFVIYKIINFIIQKYFTSVI